MSETTTFRTAVGGFHKGDVSAYISKTAAAHQAQVAGLENRLETLQQENDRLRQQLLEQSAPVPSAPEPEPEDVPEPSLKEQELAAYRRAEAAERLASQRARKLYAEMQQLCDNSGQQVAQTDSTIQTAMETINAQLDIIRTAITALHGSVRASSEELQTMGQMVPDPAEGLEAL